MDKYTQEYREANLEAIGVLLEQHMSNTGITLTVKEYETLVTARREIEAAMGKSLNGWVAR